MSGKSTAASATAPGEAGETRKEPRFRFGRNWLRFSRHIDEERIVAAEESLRTMLGVTDLRRRTFLDVGCGSGLFSLAARRLGATVTSFDYDPDSVQCTSGLRAAFGCDDSGWTVTAGSVLDDAWLRTLGHFDVVYAWGVLHHTGDMWRALDHTTGRVADGGALFISLYNDQGLSSRIWRRVKRRYNRLPGGLRFLVLLPAAAFVWGRTALADLLHGRPFASFRQGKKRGMSRWHDLVDWVGGYPFEVAAPDAVFDFCSARGFTLARLVTSRGGCNQFVFRRSKTD